MIKHLFTTKIGSHMWHMQTPKSDIDLFTVYIAPSKDILLGIRHDNSHHSVSNGQDRVSHEVGKVIKMLIKNNVNYIEGVMSPLFVRGNKKNYEELQHLTKNLISKKIYYSIHGLAASNYNKYIVTGKDISAKMCNTIVRVLDFGTKILNNKDIEFCSVSKCTPKDVKEAIEELDIAFKESRLPLYSTKKAVKNINKWLLNLRLENLNIQKRKENNNVRIRKSKTNPY